LIQSFVYDRSENIVDTSFGKVRGVRDNGMYIFKGIPYAAAERFHAPHPPEKWSGVKDCSVYGCVSPLLHFNPPGGDQFLVPSQYWVQGENCQNLNVWTQSINSAERKPVMVWIHGGGFSDGSSIAATVYDGYNFARHNDCVFVSINHRLNIFGYLDVSSYGSEYYNSGNNGQLDIIESLKWVRDNIAGFGGDPGNVTIMGHSGGGGKVSTLLSMHAADGLYHKAIILSGILSLHDAEVLEEPKECVAAMMDFLGCETIKDMEKVPFTALAYAYSQVRPAIEKEGKCTGCMPYRNGEFTGNPFHVGFRTETIGIPLLIGSVFGEGHSFLNKGVRRDTITAEEGRRLITDRLGEDDGDRLISFFSKAYPDRNPADLLFCDSAFREATSRYARLRAQSGGKVWTYMYALDSSIDGGRPAWHGCDLAVVFGNADMAPACFNAEHSYEVQETVLDCIGSFMRTGDPNTASTEGWEPVTAEHEHTLVIEASPRIGVDYDRDLQAELLKDEERLGKGGGFSFDTDM